MRNKTGNFTSIYHIAILTTNKSNTINLKPISYNYKEAALDKYYQYNTVKRTQTHSSIIKKEEAPDQERLFTFSLAQETRIEFEKPGKRKIEERKREREELRCKDLVEMREYGSVFGYDRQKCGG